MIVQIEGHSKEKIQKILSDANIDYEDITYSVYSLHIREDVNSVFEWTDYNYDMLSKKQLKRLYEYAEDRICDYDFGDYNYYIEEIIDDFMSELEEE